MDSLIGCAANSAHGERLGGLFGSAIVTRRDALLDGLNLTVETGCATLNEWYISSQAHFIHVPSCFQVIEGIENDAEVAEPRNSEFIVLDIGMMRDDLDFGIESLRSLFSNLFVLVNDGFCALPRVRLTKDLDFLICSCRKRNCRLRLDRSIVSRSTI